MSSSEPALVNHHKIAYFHESPFQIPVHIATDLTHPRATTAGMHTRHKACVASQVRGCWKSIDSADFQHENHAEDLSYAWQRLQQIGFHAHLHNRFQPLLRR